MKNFIYIISCMLSGFLFTGCQDDFENENSNGKGKNNENGFSLSYKVSGNYSSLTRSVVDLEDGEDTINSFYILFFEKTSGGTGHFIDAIDAHPGDGSLESSGTLEISYPEGSELNGSTDYNLLLCANIEEYTNGRIRTLSDLKEACYDLTENEVAKSLLIEIEGVTPAGPSKEEKEKEQEDNIHLMEMENLPMSASVVKAAAETELTVDLIRAVSRFDVICKVENATLVSASVWNAYVNTSSWGTTFTSFNGVRTERYYGVKTTDGSNQIIGSLYAFENYVKSPVQNDKASTCLIIGIQRGKNIETEYFRLNINDTNLGQQLKRNNVYSTTILHLNSKGDETERDAYENPERTLEYLIVEKPNKTEFSAGGGYTDAVRVFASGPWTATVPSKTCINTTALFDEPEEEEEEEDDENSEPIEDDGDDDNNNKEKEDKETGVSTWNSSKGNVFVVSLSALKDFKEDGSATIKVTLDKNSNIFDTFTLTQRKLADNDVVIQCRWAGQHGTMANLRKDATRRYVYNLASNFRNSALFGNPSSTVVPMENEVVFLKEKNPNSKTDIYQLTYYQILSSQYKNLYNWHKAENNRLLFLTSKSVSQTSMDRYVKQFNLAEGYTVQTTNAKANVERRFNPKADMDHPLIKYLLEAGPATKGIKIDPDYITFKSKGSVNRALSKWPSTFIPIIMAGGNDEHCVFGIDPDNRFIFLGDPAIFGSYTSKDLNYLNFNAGHIENEKFMNNFIAWMTHVAMQGPTFLDQFKK